MSPSYEYAYMIEEGLTALFSALATSVPTGLLGIAGYVLTALALYTLAQRRGISKPWLSWIPVVNVWLLGSLSDQYRYVVRGEYRSKRKILLVLSILAAVLKTVVFGVLVGMITGLISGVAHGMREQQLLDAVLSAAISMAGLALPLVGISIALAVIRFMALYDVYVSMDPGNSTLYLVLSILFYVTEPFFLFFNRNKDLGMPPRKQEPEFVPEQEPQWQQEQPQWQQPRQPVSEPWENTGEKDYL